MDYDYSDRTVTTRRGVAVACFEIARRLIQQRRTVSVSLAVKDPDRAIRLLSADLDFQGHRLVITNSARNIWASITMENPWFFGFGVILVEEDPPTALLRWFRDRLANPQSVYARVNKVIEAGMRLVDAHDMTILLGEFVHLEREAVT